MSNQSNTLKGTLARNVLNWTSADLLKLEASFHPNPEIGALVSMTTDGGSMRFQHSLSPTQARQMAADLLALADFADALTAEYHHG